MIYVLIRICGYFLIFFFKKKTAVGVRLNFVGSENGIRERDEPTNHLDMQSIDALCDALDEFEGGVVVISHDSQLLSRLCADEERSEVWIVDDGKINFYNGDFDDYRNELIREINAELDEDEAEA